MKCVNPFVQHGAAFGCGRCLPCRIDRRRVWTTRLMLENLTVRESTFVTLTYKEEMLPLCSYGSMNGTVSVSPTLVPSDMARWLKRLRRAVAPNVVRFFGVGEYGEEKERPHYHVALFGVDGCVYQDSRLSPDQLCRCNSCVLLRSTWRDGFVHQGTIELKSMQYLCSYMLKGMYRKDDQRLRGRAPEFRRMSLRPGIGAPAAVYLAQCIRRYGLGGDRITPGAYRFGERILPVGKYVRKLVRREMGLGDACTDEEVALAKERMRPLYEIAARLTEKTVARTVSDKLLYRLIVEANREKGRQLEARERIFNPRGMK